MSIDEANELLRGFSIELELDFSEETQRVSEMLVRKIKERIQGRGENKHGGQFSDYKDEWRKKREKKGLQTGHKDYTFRGLFMSDFRARKKTTEKGLIISDVGLSVPKNQRIESGHTAYEGVSILEPNKEEEKQAELQLERFVAEKLERIFQ